LKGDTDFLNALAKGFGTGELFTPQYYVSIEKSFDADSFEDAVKQMIAWLETNIDNAEYTVQYNREIKHINATDLK
jgi:hypothetical protein